MLSSLAASIFRSLTETCIDFVQDNSGTDDVHLSIPNSVEFEDVRDSRDNCCTELHEASSS